MKISIVGLGNLGTAIAYVAAGNGHRVHCWGQALQHHQRQAGRDLQARWDRVAAWTHLS
jgi:glycerol-3-phosphate dehydrogenase